MRTTLLSLVLLLPALPLAGQDWMTACPSQVIRWYVGGQKIEGRILAPSGSDDSIRVMTLSGRPTTRTIARTTPGLACRIRASAKSQGVLKGLVAGVGAGVVLGFTLNGNDKCDESWCVFGSNAGEKAAAGALMLGPVGALVGGLSAPGAEWEELAAPLWKPQQVSLLFDGRRLGVRVAF